MKDSWVNPKRMKETQSGPRTAVIIAGGPGTRLRPYTYALPKTLVPMAGRPMLFWIVNWLKKWRIEKLVIGVAFRKELVRKYIRRMNDFGLEVRFSEHTVKGGTAEAFQRALRYVDSEDFLAMNSDELTNLNIDRLWQNHHRTGAMATMAIASFPARFSRVQLARDRRITSLVYVGSIPEAQVSIGIYMFNSKIRDFLPARGSIEQTTFPHLARRGLLRGFRLIKGEQWVTVNDVSQLREAERLAPTWT
jgi:NDP-sugar pyrophosphorylase family protein